MEHLPEMVRAVMQQAGSCVLFDLNPKYFQTEAEAFIIPTSIYHWISCMQYVLHTTVYLVYSISVWVLQDWEHMFEGF